MKNNLYEHLCYEAQSGRDVFVSHVERNEEGLVTGCVPKTNHIIVRTSEGEARCWDASECEEVIDLKSRTLV